MQVGRTWGALLGMAAAACGSGGLVALDVGDAGSDATTSAGDTGAPRPTPVEDAGSLPALDAGSARDAVADTAPPPDDASRKADAALACGAATCNGAQVCCGGRSADGGASFTCQTACPDGGFTLACDEPSDCTPAGSFCCASLTLGAGTPPACPIAAGGARCRQVCDPQIPFQCPATGQVRLCKKAADCAGDPSGYTRCCSFTQATTAATFCATPQLAQLGGGTCLN